MKDLIINNDFLEEIDFRLNLIWRAHHDKMDNGTIALMVKHDLIELDAFLVRQLNNSSSGKDYNPYGIKYLMEADQWFRAFFDKLERNNFDYKSLDAYKNHIMEEIELNTDGVF